MLRPIRLSTRAAVATLVLAAASTPLACGSDDSTTDAGTGSTTTGTQPTNQAPAWSDAPTAPLAFGQGQSFAVPLTVVDADGDAVTVTVGALPAGIEAEVVGDMAGAQTLSLYAGYAVSGAATFD